MTMYYTPADEKYLEQLRSARNQMLAQSSEYLGGNVLSTIGFDWATQGAPGWVGDSGDETSVEEVYPSPKLDPKDMSVKAETEEDRERLWKSVVDYGRS